MTRKTALRLLMLIAVCSIFLLSGCEKQEYKLALVTAESISDSDTARLCYDGMTRFAEENGLSIASYFGDCGEAVNEAVENGAEEIVLFDTGDKQYAGQCAAAHPLVDFYCLDFTGGFSVKANTYCIDADECSLGFEAGYASVMDGRKILGVQGDGEDSGYACGFVAGAGCAAKKLELKKDNVKIWYDVSGSDLLEKRITSWAAAGCQVVFCSDRLASDVLAALSDTDACAVISQRIAVDGKTAAAAVKRYDEIIYQALSLTREGGFFPGGTVASYTANGKECTLEFDKTLMPNISSTDIDDALKLLKSGEKVITSTNQPQKNTNKYTVFSMPGIIKPEEEE